MSDIILFVEDNADFRDSAARFLELNQFEVLVAGDGQEALDLLTKTGKRPDIIVSDISMPRMNGYEFFDIVYQNPKFRTVPFIFLTAHDARHDQVTGIQIGADQYLVKPFRPDELLKIIRARLQKHRMLVSTFEDLFLNIRNAIVRIISHELRTPLTYITGGFSLLEDEINKPNGFGELTDAQTILDLIHSGTDRLQRLSDQMVLLTELMSNQSHKSWESMVTSINLHEAVQSAINENAHFAKDHQSEILLESDKAIFVHGVNHLLVAAIKEPIRNAIQYSPRAAKVNIRAFKEGDKAIIEIQDKGRGIREEDVDKVWDVMMQSEREKFEQQGFGLGLTITKHVIEVHQGQATLESKVEHGTTVRLSLPIKA